MRTPLNPRLAARQELRLLAREQWLQHESRRVEQLESALRLLVLAVDQLPGARSNAALERARQRAMRALGAF